MSTDARQGFRHCRSPHGMSVGFMAIRAPCALARSQ
jgi:hypothetical protein